MMDKATVMQFEMADGTKYRITDDEGMELFLDRQVPGRKFGALSSEFCWEGLESTGVESEDNGLEEAIMFLLKVALRDTKA